MADKLNFALVTPEREFFHGQVDQVVVPGVEGEFGVLVNHAPLMSIVKPGVLRVIDGTETRRIFVFGGFADVAPDGLTVLAEEAIEDFSAIDVGALDKQLKDAEEDLRDASDEHKRAAAQRAITRAEALKAAIAGR